MTEFIGDEFTQFFDDESKRAQEQLEAAAINTAVEEELVSLLDVHRAVHLWHPDEAITEENFRAACREIAGAVERGEREAGPLAPEDEAAIVLVDEQLIKANIVMIMISKRFGLDPEVEERCKKELMATLQIRGFDEGWQRTVDTMIEGAPLDLTREEDLQIYVEESQKILFSEPHPLQTAIQEIVFSALPENDPQKAKKIVGATTQLFTHLLRASNEPARRVDAEAYTDEMFREGLLTEEQRARIKGLLGSR